MPNTIPPINADWLARMRSAKPELLRELFAMFLAEEPKRLAALKESTLKGDLELLRYHAHSLKGAAATMGMERLSAACRDLEFAAKEASCAAASLAPALAQVQREAEAVFAVMRQDVPPL